MKIPTTSALWSTRNTRKYQQIDVYIYKCEKDILTDDENYQGTEHIKKGYFLVFPFADI